MLKDICFFRRQTKTALIDCTSACPDFEYTLSMMTIFKGLIKAYESYSSIGSDDDLSVCMYSYNEVLHLLGQIF